MTAIAEQFGRDSHIIMGAVIDEAMQGRVEISVLGASDMGTRGPGVRRPAPARMRLAAHPEEQAQGQEGPAAAPQEAPTTPAQKAKQDEFGFGEVESRGQFERTDRNLFDGQDLDVPTYLRKGIKIAI